MNLRPRMIIPLDIGHLHLSDRSSAKPVVSEKTAYASIRYQRLNERRTTTPPYWSCVHDFTGLSCSKYEGLPVLSWYGLTLTTRDLCLEYSRC